jgi:two-component system response regulator PilR (NtrC family)
VITAHGNVEAAVRALKLGAFDFISKPLDLGALRKLISATLKLGESTTEETQRHSALRLLGESRPMRQLREMIAKVARSQAPVHISGESGTGKELVARLIHESGARRDAPFVPVNCGAIPSELMESELFGHRKGSFTGAVADKEGLIRSAEGGTLFLDEVADLPLHMQVKLLRVIQEKAVRPVGESREVPVDVRILSATHRDLGELVKAGRFREDLFYRINVIELTVPALRERRDDLPLLIRHFIQTVNAKLNRSIRGVDDQALKRLHEHAWPGNVGELERVLTRAAIVAGGDVITSNDISFLTDSVFLAGTDGLSTLERSARAALQERLVDSPSSGGNSIFHDIVDAVETALVKEALTITNGNQVKASELLGLNRATLRKKAGSD